MPIEVETALFRIVQESLTNVVLHAQAARVDVLLSRTDKRVSAIIEDNGVGFIPAFSMTEEQLGLLVCANGLRCWAGHSPLRVPPEKARP